MMGRLLFKEVFRELLANKINIFFITLALVFSLTALNTIYALGKSAEKQILDTLANLNFGKDALLVLAGGSRIMGLTTTRTDTLLMDDIIAIEKLGFVKMTSPFTGGSVEVSYRGKAEKVRLDGVLPIYLQANNWELFRGKFFNEEDVKNFNKVVVLGYEIARKWGGHNLVGEKIKIQDQYYRVIGILEKKGSLGHFPLDERIFVPLTTAQKRIFNQNYLRGVKIILQEDTPLSHAERTIRKLLRERHNLYGIAPDDFRIVTPEMVVARHTATSKTLSAFLLTIAFISLVISGVIIMNLMTASVEEKAGIIALRIAVGAQPWHIIKHYLISALILALVSGIIGWLLSILLMFLLSLLTPLKPLFSWGTFLLSLLFSTITCITFSLFPAIKASRIDPAILLKGL
ncbi:MAG: ABC transporter permease [Caldimicrobium sp.]|nr:ABC transporter permease [Caldimicrobium sp.]MCX7614091.1 ABC transporter permease [Caldimicrobium sp.]MDW8182830.1 ABC transporter permease [Caldimicrobium sp.]